jgi:hypothetical protein
LIYSQTADENLEHIRLVLRELQRHNLYMNLSKSYFGRTSVIRCCVHPLHDDWAQHPTNVEFAINAAAFASTTMSPFKATLGFEPISPTHATFETNDPVDTLPEQAKILVEMHKFTHDRIKAAQAHMQEYANRHRLPTPFTVGDKVKLKAANIRVIQQPCSKLRDRYIAHLSLRRRFLRLRFGLSYPPGYESTMLYTLFY